MTNRVQVFRTPTTGVAPAAGARLPGELWVNFADFQLGMIDASKNAQKLVAVRYFQTTANYAVGEFVIQAGVLYVAKGAITAGAFNSTQWTKVAAATDAGGPYLAIAGGTLTGDLVLNRDPQVALGAATKQYVDGKVSAAPFLPIAGGTLTGKLTLAGSPSAALDAATKAYVDAGAFVPVGGGANTGLNDNRIINGDFRIDQRWNGASGTAAGYTVDRWKFSAVLATKGTWGQNIGSRASVSGFPYYLGFSSNSAYTSATGDWFELLQSIEADAISDFAWGTAGAQSVTLSFWAQSNVTGTFGGCVANAANTRSYPFTFSLPNASVWTRCVITIPGDTAGTWVMNGNAASIMLQFDLGSGATYRGPANVWAPANYVGVTGTVSVVAASGAFLLLTGVKLEIGSVATSYNRQSLAKSMADCQRYYVLGSSVTVVGYAAGAGGAAYGHWEAPVSMRATPSITGGAWGSPANANGGAAFMSDSRTVQGSITSIAAGQFSGNMNIAALDAEL